MFKFKNKTILILSPEDWGTNQLSKHLYAKELSKNNTVYFLHTSPHPSQKKSIKVSKINNALYLIHLKKVVRGIFKLPSFAIDIQNKSIVKRVLQSINRPIDVVWSFDQSKFQNLKQFNAHNSIFHPVDYIEGAAPFLNKIANSANIVLSVSEKILNEIKTSTPKHFINHGLDNIFTQKTTEDILPKFIDKQKINVGYVGNLQIKLMDWKALINTIKLNPEINFVFIGPDKPSNIGGHKKFADLDIVKSFENTFFTGSMSKTDLHKTFSYFDAFLISYDHKTFPIQVSNSHKILEYLSTGKTIVSNYISTYDGSELFEYVRDNADLPSKLAEVSKNIESYNSAKKMNARINFAIDNTYTKQIARIENLLN